MMTRGLRDCGCVVAVGYACCCGQGSQCSTLHCVDDRHDNTSDTVYGCSLGFYATISSGVCTAVRVSVVRLVLWSTKWSSRIALALRHFPRSSSRVRRNSWSATTPEEMAALAAAAAAAAAALTTEPTVRTVVCLQVISTFAHGRACYAYGQSAAPSTRRMSYIGTEDDTRLCALENQVQAKITAVVNAHERARKYDVVVFLWFRVLSSCLP